MNVEKANIALIEDNPYDVELTLHALKKRHLANSVKVLTDGEEALDYLSTQCHQGGTECPDLILLDLKLPKVDGLEVLQRIRSNEDTKLIPVAVMTSSAKDADRIESNGLGINGYLVKPVGFDNFAQLVADIGFYWILTNTPAETDN